MTIFRCDRRLDDQRNCAFPNQLLEGAAEEDPEGVEAQFYPWLAAEAEPEDWHRFALDCNWGMHDPELYEWIASQPECDKATALVFFWKASPEYQLEIVDHSAAQPEETELLDLIRQRWLAAKYTRSRIAFDHVTDVWPIDYDELDRRYGDIARKILPPEMRVEHLGGERLSVEDCIEGIPKRFWPEDLR